MGGAVCMGQPQQKIMKLKPPINGEGEQIINNFDYEEFAFEKEENDGPSKVKAGGNPNRKGDNDENAIAEIKNEYYNNAKEQADNLSKEILDNEKNLSEALKNIKREDYTSEEEYRKALDDTAKYYLNRDAYLRA